MAEVLVRSIALACPVEHAFEVFVDKVDLWWPRGHRHNRDGVLRLEPRENGALIERARDGSERAMARVTAIEPPTRLELDWYPGASAAPTSVEILFARSATGTEITVTHRPLPDSQSIWPRRVELFTQGWDAVLPALRTFIEET